MSMNSQHGPFSETGLSKQLDPENFAMGAYEFSCWNIANWNLAEGAE